MTARRNSGSAAQPGRRLGLTVEQIRERLDALQIAYGNRYLDTDPLGLVRRFDRAEDREAAGVLAAALAYGRVEHIRSSLGRLFGILGPRPSRFLDAFDPARDAARLSTFRHRFTTGQDVALFLWLLLQARARAGSLEAFFLEGDTIADAEDLGTAMDAFGRRLFALDARPFHPEGVVPARSGARWLLPVPSGGSACKRHCLFLRWMVRPDDGVDCGVWTRGSRARLVIPLDVHLQRLASAAGWTHRRSSSWSMAVEVTRTLRRLDPADPTRYDFALCRLGILGAVGSRGRRVRPRDIAAALADATLKGGAFR
jgi:uncharacterized protein (TIGR02757 family)